ncbi:ribonuclease H-like domain-containing protein [Tanacetum coccineum]
MVSFRRIHSHLKLLSNNDLKGTRTECGFKHAFATLFGQNGETFIGTMFLNLDQLEKQLDNEEFQEIGSMAAFKTTKEKVDTSKALDTSLVDTKSSRTESGEQDTSSRSGNDAHADDADIRPIYMKSQWLSKEANVKHDIDVIETINIELEHKVAKLLKENETLKRHYKVLSDSIKTTRAKTIEHTTSLIAQNVKFKAQLQDKVFAIAALKNELRKLTGNSMNTKFAKSSILGKPVLQSLRNQSVVRQPTTFKSERPRISKPRFASQVDVNNDLPKPVTTHYLPRKRESAFAKPHHMIAPSSLGFIQKGHRFSIKKTSVVHEKTMNPRSCLRWKPTGKIFKYVGLMWVPTGKIFTSSTTKVDSEPTNGSNDDITNQYECEQTLDVSACTLNLSAAMTSDHNSSELRIHDHSNEPSSLKMVPKVVPPADKKATSQQELELIFSPMYEEYFNAGNQNPDLYLQYKMSGEEPTPQMAPVESPYVVSSVKLPILKKDENGVETEVPPKTTQALLQRQRERKAKSIFLLAFPDEYQLRFHGIKDSKTLWAAIKSRFGGNVESKKMQKNKFLRALPSSWNNVALIMRNKTGIDDLYNNLKVFKADIKSSSGSSSNSHNVAFLSAEDTNSINEVNTANGVSTASGHNSQRQATSSTSTNDLMFSFFTNQSNSPQLDDKDLEQIDHDDLEEMDLKWQVAVLSMRVKRFYKKTRRKLIFNGKEPVGFDKTKVECFNYHKRGHFFRECRATRNQGNMNGDAGYRSKDNTRRIVPVETSDALVVQDNALII